MQNIAVGVDESSAAVGALAWAGGLARETGASIVAIHSWQTPFVCTYPGATPSTEELADHARGIIHTALDKADVAERVETIVIQGAPGPTVVDQARRADLMVVGCTGGGLQRYKPELGEVLFGSTARYAVHHASVPVAAIPEGAAWKDTPTVVIGLDGSPASLAALKWAVAELPAACELLAVQAVEYPCTGGSIPIDYELLDPMVDAHHQQLNRLVADALDTDEQRHRVKTHVVFGAAADALIDPSRRGDVIVIGEHGSTAAGKRVIGSVSDHTLRHANVPVVVVPVPTIGEHA